VLAGTAWQQLCRLDAYRVAEIPRRAVADGAPAGGERDAGRIQRMAALLSAYHAAAAGSGQGAVAVGWIRLGAGGPVDVLEAGSALCGSTLGGGAAGGEAVLALPAGARARLLPRGAVAGAMAAIPCWEAIAGIADGLIADPAAAQHDRGAPSLEDCLLAVWAGPFAWLLVAEPLGTAELDEIAGQVADRQRLVRGLAESSPERAVQAQRLEHRHTELRQAFSTGMWRVHLLAGGASPRAAAQVAGLVRASADLGDLPYALAPSASAGDPGSSGVRRGYPPGAVPPPASVAGALRDILDAPAGDGGAGSSCGESAAAYPFCASTELLAALTGPPKAEVPGIRLSLRSSFDVTPEPGAASVLGAGVRLGAVLDRNRAPAGELVLPAASLNRHTFVCGATGAGKSQTVRGLLEAASGQGLPWLVVEPAKAEYRLMAARLAGTGAEVVRIRPGEADVIPAGINPLEPAADRDGNRFPLQTHADLVRALFMAAFDAWEPFPQVLAAALTRCYSDAGWDLALGEPVTPGVRPRYPTLGDLQAAAERVVAEIGYSKEITDNVRGFIRVRLSSLRLGTTGRFFEGGHPIDFGRLLDRNVVFEIEDVGDDRDTAFLMGTVLIRLTEHLRMVHRGGAGGAGGPGGPARLRHLSVFEEAHRLLRNPGSSGGAAAHAVEMLAGMLAEIRAYGEGLVIAEQIPAKLVPDVIKNTAVKIVHRLPAADDRDAVGATMNLTADQSRFLVTLVPGEAAVFTDGMDYPLLVRMPDGTEREAASRAVTASAAAVVSPRSLTCGESCRESPCTLRDMRAAQRALDGLPALALWAELAVLAHLTGWSMPVPSDAGELAGSAGAGEPAALAGAGVPPLSADARVSKASARAGAPMMPTGAGAGAGAGAPLLSADSHVATVHDGTGTRLARMSSRLRDCAISHAVDAAVAARSAAISSRISPAALSAHVAAAIRARLADGDWVCDKEEPRWLAPQYRWTMVLDALSTAGRAGPHSSSGPHPRSGDGPHPRSGEWAETYGQAIPGESCAHQLAVVKRWHEVGQRDVAGCRVVAFGAGSPSVIEKVIGACVDDDDYERRLSEHLENFRDCKWPLKYLADPPASPRLSGRSDHGDR